MKNIPENRLTFNHSLTILSAKNNGLAAKTLTLNPDGGFETDGYDVGSRFGWRTVVTNSIYDIADAVRGLGPNEFPVPGRVQRPTGRKGKPRDSIARTGDELFPHVDGVKQSRGATLRRWGMVDFDGVFLPDHFDLRTEGADAIEWAIHEYLPECFHDVTCFWQLSSSAGIKPGLNAHIWFYFDREVMGGWLADYFVAEGSPVDPVVFRNDVQPHYSVPPIFTNCPDPIQNREGILEREADAVALPHIEQRQLVVTAKSLGRGDALLDDAHGFTAKVALIGDGPGLAGFHRPITSAIFSALLSAASNGQSQDAVAIKEYLKEVIHNAPKALGRDARRYLSDEYLDASIRDAIPKVDRIIAERHQDRPAYYPAPKGSVGAAQHQIAATMENFRRDVRVRWELEAARDALEDDETPVDDLAARALFDSLTCKHDIEAIIEGYKAFADSGTPMERNGFPRINPWWKPFPEQLASAIFDKLLDDKLLDAQRDRLLITPTGSGKSTQARDSVEGILDDNPGKTVVIATPRHALNEEQAVPLRAALAGKYTVGVYRGRGADDPEAPGEKMCRVHETAAQIQSAGGDVEKMLCGSGKRLKNSCPHFNTCGYRRQQASKADVIFCAQNLMTSRTPDCFGVPAAVFVDENPIDCFLAGVDYQNPIVMSFGVLHDIIDELTIVEECQIEKGNWSNANEQNPDQVALTELLDALKAHPDGPLKTNELPKPGEITSSIWGTKRKLKLKPNMSPRDRDAEIAMKGPHNKNVRLVVLLIKKIREYYDDGDTIPGISKGNGGLYLSWRRERGDGWDAPTMFMDATGNPTLYKTMFPTISDDNITTVTCAAPHMSVRQVVDWNGSRNKLVPNSKDGKPEQIRTAENNIQRLARYVECRADEFKGQGALINFKHVDVLVVTYKATAEILETEGLPDGVEVAYFGNLTGIDRWKGVRCIIVAGGAQVGVDAVEAMAEVIKGAELDPLDHSFGEWYAKETVGGRRRGKDEGPGLVRYYHNDPIAEAVRQTKVEGELIQVIGRGREIRRGDENPLQVDILCNTPLPVEVDDFVKWTDIQPTTQEVIAARGVKLNVVPSQRQKGYWECVSHLAPDLHSTPEAARGVYRRLGGQSLIDNSIYANDRLRAEATPGSVGDFRGWGLAKVRIGKRGWIEIRFEADCDLMSAFPPGSEIEVVDPPARRVRREGLPRIIPMARMGFYTVSDDV